MPIGQKERIEILKEIAASWLALRKTVQRLSEAQLTRPGTIGDWSIKDVLAHISFWERRGIEKLARAERGEPLGWPKPIEEMNREQAERDAGRTTADVLTELDQTHQELMSALEVSPALTRDLVAGLTAKHYDEHRRDIEQAVAS